MALNLNALKNIPVASLDSLKIENIPVPVTTTPSSNKISLSKIVPSTTSANTTSATEKIPSTGPKISLMKLKQDSQGTIPTSQLIQEPLLEKVEQEITIIEIADQTEKNQDISQVLPLEIEWQESFQSIFSNVESETVISEEEIIPEQVSRKELFPNFHIANELGLDDDILNLNLDSDGIIKDHEDFPATTKEVTQVKMVDVTDSNTDMQEIIEIQIPIAETVNAEEVELIDITTENMIANPPVITPEYVAEVKTELSEQRRAGFRFFRQKKTKIMAGVSFLIVSISAGILFSSSFLSTDLQKSGKSNIQEVIKNTTPAPVIIDNTTSGATSEPIISTTENSNYKIGIDYTITKNTKKNVSTRKIPETLTGAEIPTP